MVRRPTRSQAREFARLISTHEPQIRRGFMASVTDLQSNVDWPELIKALEGGNLDTAIAALNIHPAAWSEYSAAVSTTFAAAGSSTAAQVAFSEGVGVGVRFNMQNPRAERWVAENVANKVVGFAEEQIQVSRNIIASGYHRGDGPRNIAYDLVGRVGATGSRQGGILGLDNPRAERLYNVTVGMRTPEGVQDLVVNGRVRYKVNEATERRILAAYQRGEAVPLHERVISERQYKNLLLKQRADTVAETETGNAVMSGRQEEWMQAAESKGLDESAIIKTWKHRRGASAHHRPDHLAMNNVSVEGLDTPFILPDGTLMQHAHDSDAGPEHIIRCGCDTEYRLKRRVE